MPRTMRRGRCFRGAGLWFAACWLAACGGGGSSTGTGGSSGTTGVAGSTGEAGTSGGAGTTGAAGSGGSVDTTGTAGTSGAAGTTGSAGTTGTAGASGTTGAAGRGGTTGAAGRGGTTGTAGTMGAAGTTGTGVNTLPFSFFIGADVTDQEPQPVATRGNLLTLMKSHGFNYIRLRTFVDPKASDGYDKNNGYDDITHTVDFGKQIKDAGMGLLVDFHYSDNWADPGKQCVPVPWYSATTIAELSTLVHD